MVRVRLRAVGLAQDGSRLFIKRTETDDHTVIHGDAWFGPEGPTEHLGAPTKNRCPFVLGLPSWSASAVFNMLTLLYLQCLVRMQQHLKCFTPSCRRQKVSTLSAAHAVRVQRSTFAQWRAGWLTSGPSVILDFVLPKFIHSVISSILSKIKN